jgi:REP element-mobilizing transposase RayT
MTRPLRIELAGGLYHVTSRGDRQEDIYFSDEDRLKWLEILGEVCSRCNWRCHAWCQMSNHYHLVVETPEANLAQGMRLLNGVYTQHINREHRRVGHVFQGRYKAVLVERDAYLLELARYVVLNPVRAGMVSSPDEWSWSSWAAMMGQELVPEWLETGWLLLQFSQEKGRARRAFDDFVRAGVGLPSVWGELSGQIYLGSEQFIRTMQAGLSDQLENREIPRLQRRPVALPLSDYQKLHPERDDAIRAAFASGDYTQPQIAAHFGVHYSTVSRVARRRNTSEKL